jgi:hypothetical protein
MQAAFEAVEPRLGAKSKIAKQVASGLDGLGAAVNELRTPTGFPPFDRLALPQVRKIGVQLEELTPVLGRAQEQVEGVPTL